MKILVLLLAALPLCGQFRYTWPFWGLDATSANNDLNTSASGGYSQSWVELGFVPSYSKTLSKVRFNVGTVVGTLGSSDVCVALYSDSSGAPGTATETRCTVTTTPTAAAWVEATGFTTALTRNTYYHLVFLNANSAPTSNYYRITALTLGDGNAAGSGLTTVGGGYRYQTSTTSGSSWSASSRAPGVVVEYDEGTREGFPFKAATTLQIYGTRKAGTEITIQPGGPHLAIRGVLASVAKTGSPTSLKLSVLRGTGNSRTAICTTGGSIAGAQMSTTRHSVMMWCDEGRVVLAPGETVAIVGETTNTSDSSSNRTNFGLLQFWSADYSLVSTGYTLKSILSTDGGSTWATTDYEFANLAFIGDDGRPYQVVSGGTAITQ